MGRTLLIAASSTAGVVYGIDLNEAGAIRWRTPAPALTAASSAWRKLVVLPRDSPGGNPVVAMFGSSAEVSFPTLMTCGDRVLNRLPPQSSTFELDTATGELLAVRGMVRLPSRVVDRRLTPLFRTTFPATPLWYSKATASWLARALFTIACVAAFSQPTPDPSSCVLTPVVGSMRMCGRSPCQLASIFKQWSIRILVRPIPPCGKRLKADHPQGAIASLGRILGNRTTLTKYLNPHLTAVVTLHPSTSSASILLVDSSSGAITQTIHVSRVTSDSELRAVLRGNWLVYTLREPGDSAQATQVVSVELYSDVQQPFRSVQLSFAAFCLFDGS